MLKIPGDNERDAVCGNFKSGKFLALSVFEILLKKRERWSCQRMLLCRVIH